MVLANEKRISSFVSILCMITCRTFGIPLAENVSVKGAIRVTRIMEVQSLTSNISGKFDGQSDKYKFAGGMVSVNCLRCLCLAQSNCEPIGCIQSTSLLLCGYFRISYPEWKDCRTRPGIKYDFKKCSDDIMCSSKCIQNYMDMYVDEHKCVKTCESYARELYAGPNGCNNPRSLKFWNDVQKVPGCKGVE